MPRTTISSRLRLLGGVGILSVALLSGCGSSSKSDSSGSATTAAGTLSKSDFVSQANGVCKDLGATAKTANAAIKSSTDAKDSKIASDALGAAGTKFAELRTKAAAMQPPSDGENAQKALVAVLDKFATKYQGYKTVIESAAAGGDVPADDSAAFQKDVETTAKPIADYGISC